MLALLKFITLAHLQGEVLKKCIRLKDSRNLQIQYKNTLNYSVVVARDQGYKIMFSDTAKTQLLKPDGGDPLYRKYRGSSAEHSILQNMSFGYNYIMPWYIASIRM